MPVGAAAREDRRPTSRPERDRLVDRLAEREAVGEARGEAVAAAVRIGHRPGKRRGAERAAGADPAAEVAGGRDDDRRLGLELARLEPLGGVLPAPDQHVDLHAGAAQRRKLPRRRDEDGRAARGAQRGDVPAHEVDGVAAV